MRHNLRTCLMAIADEVQIALAKRSVLKEYRTWLSLTPGEGCTSIKKHLNLNFHQGRIPPSHEITSHPSVSPQQIPHTVHSLLMIHFNISSLTWTRHHKGNPLYCGQINLQWTCEDEQCSTSGLLFFQPRYFLGPGIVSIRFSIHKLSIRVSNYRFNTYPIDYSKEKDQ